MFLALCGRGRCLSSKLSTTVKVTTRFGQTNRYAGYPQFTLSKSPLTTRINSCGKYRANQTNPPSIQHICGFRTSQQNRAFHPVIWVLLKPALKIVTVITSRVYRQWFKDLPRWKKIMYVLTYVSVVGLPLILMYHLYNSNQVTPITNRKQFIILTPEQVLKVSEFEAEQHITQFKDKMLPATHPFYQPLLWVAQRLLQANQDLPILKDLKWKLCIVEDSALNAFVLPSGHVFFTTAILEMMENEDQLAVVFGHEMAHAVCSHSIEALSKSQFMDYCIIFFMTAIWTIIPSDGIAIITQYFMEKIMHYTFTLTFSRELEEEADVVGLEMAAKACFDVREGSVLWRRMMMIRDLTGTKGLEFTSTHPSNENRITTMEKLLSKTIAIRDACNCPKLPDLDPRIRVKAIQKKVDNVVIARKAGQNLALVPKVTSSGRIITQK
ncbi:metalloendopeptidase OMA1, mitochondrial-like [Ylistrum balloti]|uniref:metalloendopeptidase OMA1, mitochondrial-like n=1 Tax=Ylistrum balloti TaxID=509963 RepID=UPI0029058605|nr:metalloendopeptidase OMA1, mitochondrial-like [Ylistrum balloti]